MKKVLLAAVFVVLSFVGTAQEFINTFALEVGYWNSYTEKWMWESRTSCNVSFILQGPSIVSNDKAKSTYYTYETLSYNDTGASWSALDEKQRECMISIQINTYENYFVVMYYDICYRYVYRK